MARFSVEGRSAGAGSATLPLASLYAGASGGGRLREVGIINTTPTALVVGLARLSTTGTQGAALTEAKQDPNSGPALCEAFNTHTVAPTLAALGYRFDLGAAVGAAVVWTFADSGLVIPVGTANGIGIYIPSGTGQVCDFYFVWDE